MDLTFQVPMQYCSLQHQNLLSPPDTSPQLGILSTLAQPLYYFLSYLIFLELYLFSSSILHMYWPGVFIYQCHIFLPFHTVHGVFNAKVVYHSLLQWTVLCQNSPEPDMPLSVSMSLAEAQVSSGLSRGQGYLPQQSWKAQHVTWQT